MLQRKDQIRLASVNQLWTHWTVLNDFFWKPTQNTPCSFAVKKTSYKEHLYKLKVFTIVLLQDKLCLPARKMPKILTQSHYITMEGCVAAMSNGLYYTHCTTSFPINKYYYRMFWFIWFRWRIKWENKYYIYLYTQLWTVLNISFDNPGNVCVHTGTSCSENNIYKEQVHVWCPHIFFR